MVGKNTPLGTYMNELSSKQDGTRVQQVRHAVGTIVAFGVYQVDKTTKKRKLVKETDPSKDGVYKFIVRTLKGQETSFLSLIGEANEHAGSKGNPGELLGKACYISYRGPSINRGSIINLVDDFIDPAAVGTHNELPIAGAAFAPPGNGLI